MHIIPILKIIFLLLLGWITYTVIKTSLESNLFEEWDALGNIPWMRATLWDFYANAFVIYLWILYKEKSAGMKILWLLLLFCLGSIATCVYVLIQLFKLKSGQGIRDLVVQKS